MVSTRLGRLHVRRLGDVGQPVILWSSMFVDGHTWDGFIPHLTAHRPQRRFVIVDPPGLGLSDPLLRASSIAEAADAAVDLLAGLGFTGTPVDWVGNAFGGHVGFDLATRPRVLRSLVAVSSPAEALPASLRRQINLLKPLLRAFGPVAPVRQAVIGAMLTDDSAARPDLVRVVLDSLDRPTRRSLSLALKSFILERIDVSAALANIRVPALFVASDDRGDWSPADAERSAARVANGGASAVTIAGARTLVPLEQPAALAAEVAAFWRSL